MDQETQSTISEHLRNWGDDFRHAVALLTRIPLPQPASVTASAAQTAAARSRPAFPDADPPDVDTQPPEA